MNIDIREPTDRDYSARRVLWEGYTQFYNSPQPETVTEHTRRRLLDPQSPVIGRVAVVEGEVLGFAICVLHEGTWVTTPVCYLEDLFVAPKARGRGVARTLIRTLQAEGKNSGDGRGCTGTPVTIILHADCMMNSPLRTIMFDI